MFMSELNKVIRLYARAERAIKRTERITLQLPVAPVNQLRYAGFHVLRAISRLNNGELNEDIQDDIQKAESHCRRSWLDSFECMLLYLLRSVQTLYREASQVGDLLQRHPILISMIDEVAAIESDFEKVPLSTQSMSVGERVKLLHEAQRLGIIKRQLLRAYSTDGKAGNGTPRSREKAKAVAACLQDRQFLVSFTATVCGTVIGLISLVACIVLSDVRCKFLWSMLSLLTVVMIVMIVWRTSKRYLSDS